MSKFFYLYIGSPAAFVEERKWVKQLLSNDAVWIEVNDEHHLEQLEKMRFKFIACQTLTDRISAFIVKVQPKILRILKSSTSNEIDIPLEVKMGYESIGPDVFGLKSALAKYKNKSDSPLVKPRHRPKPKALWNIL